MKALGTIKRWWYNTYNPEYRIIEIIRGDEISHLVADYRINRMSLWKRMYRADMTDKVLADVYVGSVNSDSYKLCMQSGIKQINRLITDHRTEVLSKKTLSKRVISDK